MKLLMEGGEKKSSNGDSAGLFQGGQAHSNPSEASVSSRSKNSLWHSNMKGQFVEGESLGGILLWIIAKSAGLTEPCLPGSL